MFKGVVHANARKVIAAYIKRLPRAVHILCSGNFTVESTLRLNGYVGQMTSCDVSIYTCALGNALTNVETDIQFQRAKEYPELEILNDWCDTPTRQGAAVSCAFALTEFIRQRNPFEKRMYRAYVRELEDHLQTTEHRIIDKAKELQLTSYHGQDAWQRAQEIPEGDDHCVMAFPPTYGGGDYARMFKAVGDLFQWVPPQFKELAAAADFFSAIKERPGPWLILSENRNAAIDEQLGQPVSQVNRGATKQIWLYTNIPNVNRHVIRRKMQVVKGKLARFSDNDEITKDSVCNVVPCDSNEAMYFRQCFSSVKPLQSQAPFCFAVTIDGKVAGIMMMSLANFSVALGNEVISKNEIIYMMSDLPAATRRHSRLSKLVATAAKSKEVQQLLQGKIMQPIRFVLTTAFSEKPTSMKYRGPFKVASRERRDDGQYQINYYAKMGDKSISEIFKQWMKTNYKAQTNS